MPLPMSILIFTILARILLIYVESKFVEVNDMTWRGWTTLVAGVWFVIAAFISMGGTGNLINDLIVGIIVAVVGFLMLPEGAAWQGWIIGIIGGIWMIIAAFIPQIAAHYTANMINDLVVGIIIIVIALFERSKKRA